MSNIDNIIDQINHSNNINELTNILFACEMKIKKLESVENASKFKLCCLVRNLNEKQKNVINTLEHIYYDTTYSYKHVSSKIKFLINNIEIVCVYDQGDVSLTVGNIKIVEYDSYVMLQNLHNNIKNNEIEKNANILNLNTKEYIEIITCVVEAMITGKFKSKR